VRAAGSEAEMIAPLIASFLLLPAQAESVRTAKKLFDQGSAAYENSEFEKAIELFEKAQEIAPRPQICFSLAQAYRRQAANEADPLARKRTMENAIRAYRQYLDLAPEGTRRTHAEQFIATLERFLEYEDRAQSKVAARTELIVMSNVGSGKVAIDGKNVELMEPVEVTPGLHTVSVEATGYFPYENRANIPEGRSITVDAELKPRPGVIRLSAPEGAEITLDGRLQGVAPFAATLEVPAGKHFVAVSERGSHPFARELELDIGEEVSLVAEMRTTPQRVISYVMMGVGAALAVGAASFATVAVYKRRSAADIIGIRDDGGSITEEQAIRYNDLLDEREQYLLTAFATGGAALVVAATAVLLYVFDTPKLQALDAGIRF
jgi:hypothetical protein